MQANVDKIITASLYSFASGRGQQEWLRQTLPAPEHSEGEFGT